jgi:hypothetical protein
MVSLSRQTLSQNICWLHMLAEDKFWQIEEIAETKILKKNQAAK